MERMATASRCGVAPPVEGHAEATLYRKNFPGSPVELLVTVMGCLRAGVGCNALVVAIAHGFLDVPVLHEQDFRRSRDFDRLGHPVVAVHLDLRHGDVGAGSD